MGKCGICALSRTWCTQLSVQSDPLYNCSTYLVLFRALKWERFDYYNRPCRFPHEIHSGIFIIIKIFIADTWGQNCQRGVMTQDFWLLMLCRWATGYQLSSETSETTHPKTQRHIAKHLNPQQDRNENVKCRYSALFAANFPTEK